MEFPMRSLLAIVLAVALLAPRPASAYVEAPMSLGSVLAQSTNVCLMTVTKVDKTQNLIIFQKTLDVKGKHPADTIKHNIGRGGLRAGEWEECWIATALARACCPCMSTMRRGGQPTFFDCWAKAGRSR